MSIRKLLLLPGPKNPESPSNWNRRVFQEPYDTVARISGSGNNCGDSRWMLPPKLVGPKSEARPALRSKSTAAVQPLGKFAQEWWVGELVSSNGIPSNVMVYWPSAKPRKYVLPWPSPIPLGFRLNVPGA